MSDAVKVGFVPFSAVPRGVLVVFCDNTLKFGAVTRTALGAAATVVGRAATANQFKGKHGVELVDPLKVVSRGKDWYEAWNNFWAY